MCSQAFVVDTLDDGQKETLLAGSPSSRIRDEKPNSRGIRGFLAVKAAISL